MLTRKIIKGLLGTWAVHCRCETTRTKVMAGEKGRPAGPCGREKLAAEFGLAIGPTEEQGNEPQLGPWLTLNFGPIGWAEMGLISKEWAWVEGNGFRKCKGAE